MTTPLADYHWLVGPAAEVWLQRAATFPGSLTSLVGQLRRQLSPTRTHLVIEQIRLRQRARSKFQNAGSMFFTARGLEQATDQRLAEFKAKHYGGSTRVMDLCCGIGGDLLALAERGGVTGYDRDPRCTVLAGANLASQLRRTLGEVPSPLGAGHVMTGHVITGDVLQAALETADAWHLDPDRRPHGHRTTQASEHEPGPATIDQLLARCPHGAIKLAPAARVPEAWEAAGDRQWLGRGRECPQMWLRFGKLCEQPGRRSVTIVGSESQGVATLVDDACGLISCSAKIQRYLHEPHAAVLAAGLVDTAAHRFGLARLAAGLVYLTGDAAIASPLIDSFEVLEVLPLDLKRIKSALRQRKVGTVEVKRRGTEHDPVQLQRQLRGRGCGQATLLLAGAGDRTWAVLARRVS